MLRQTPSHWRWPCPCIQKIWNCHRFAKLCVWVRTKLLSFISTDFFASKWSRLRCASDWLPHTSTLFANAGDKWIWTLHSMTCNQRNRLMAVLAGHNCDTELQWLLTCKVNSRRKRIFFLSPLRALLLFGKCFSCAFAVPCVLGRHTWQLVIDWADNLAAWPSLHQSV